MATQVPISSGDRQRSNTVGVAVGSITFGPAGPHSGVKRYLRPCPISTVKLTVQETRVRLSVQAHLLQPQSPCAPLGYPLPAKVMLGTLLSRRGWASSPPLGAWLGTREVFFGRIVWFISRATRCLSDQNNFPVCSQSPDSPGQFLEASGNSNRQHHNENVGDGAQREAGVSSGTGCLYDVFISVLAAQGLSLLKFALSREEYISGMTQQ